MHVTGTQLSTQSSCITNAAGPPHICHQFLDPFCTSFNLPSCESLKILPDFGESLGW